VVVAAAALVAVFAVLVVGSNRGTLRGGGRYGTRGAAIRSQDAAPQTDWSIDPRALLVASF